MQRLSESWVVRGKKEGDLRLGRTGFLSERYRAAPKISYG